MLRKIHLHGALKKFHEGPIEVYADTVAEALRIVSLQIAAFRPNAKDGYRKVQVAGCDTLESLFTESVIENIHVFPQFNGGKRGGFLQILIGAALVAASFIVPPAAGILAGILLKVGALIVLGGVLQLFAAPHRDTGPAGEQNRSHYLGAPRNTVAIGTRIPILYGRRKVGGHLLSINVSAI